MCKRLSLTSILVILTFILHLAVANADSPLHVLENRCTAHFAENLTFHLIAEHEIEIRQVILYYGLQGENLVNRIVPEFVPGRHTEATFEKTLERGEIPPGAVIEYYWRLELADGTSVDTGQQVLTYEDDRFPWRKLQADNITLLYYGDEAEHALAQDLLKQGQDTLVRLQEEIGVTLEEQVRVYAYRSSRDMAAALATRSTGFDEQILTLGVAVADNTLLLLGSAPNAQMTLAHELSHIVVGLATKNPYAPIPRWLDEGLAMYAEGELPASNAQALEQAIRNDALISVRSLSGYTGEASQVNLFYGEVYSLVEFLLDRYGRDKMGELLDTFREGTTQEDALQRVYGMGVDELDAEWRQSLGLGPRPTVSPLATVVPTALRRRPLADRLCPLPGLIAGLGLALAIATRRCAA